MDGKEGCDGTYFDAKSAVNAGILSAECVLKTSKQVCNKVKDQIEGVVEANALQKIMASINTELGNFKPLDDSSSIPNQNQIENSNSQKTMDKEQEFAFGSVCAQLGLEKTSEVSAVITRIGRIEKCGKQGSRNSGFIQCFENSERRIGCATYQCSKRIDNCQERIEKLQRC